MPVRNNKIYNFDKIKSLIGKLLYEEKFISRSTPNVNVITKKINVIEFFENAKSGCTEVSQKLLKSIRTFTQTYAYLIKSLWGFGISPKHKINWRDGQ